MAGPNSGHGGLSKENTKTTKSSTSKLHHVSSGKMYRIDQEYQSVMKEGGETYSYRRTKMYDGSQTRMLKETEYANVIKGYSGDSNYIYPHMTLMRGPFYYMRLSTLLSGSEVLSDASDANWDDSISVEYSVNPDEVVYKGLPCVRLSIFMSNRSKPAMIRNVWLAKERNYIPCKYEAFYLKISKDTPVEIGTVDEWIELEPGIWFPKTTSVTAYSPFLLTSNGDKKVQWTKRYSFEDISLSPKYPKSYFQDMQIPDGLPIHEIDKGQIIQSYRKNSLDDPDRK
ncbi:MAG: hypothetical protein P8M30_11990 [Planctomycetaceae bacterium]|nr:hypothetical protein [Planctomycetaceae bacterium]